MNKECPSCHKSIEVSESNFGSLYTCGQCSAVYFINFDGDPEYEALPSNENIMEPNISEEAPFALDNQFEQIQTQHFDYQPVSAESSTEYPVESVEMTLENPSMSVGVEMGSQEPVIEVAEDAVVEASFENTDEASSGHAVVRNPIQEINEFANSTDNNLTGLVYKVEIRGIDSKVLLQDVKEALEDGRFNWDISLILSKRKDGVIVLDDLPPVKAALIIQRLRLTGLDFVWNEKSE